MPTLQAYEKLGPVAARLHQDYLEARRDWRAAVDAQWAAYDALKSGVATEQELQAAIARTHEAHAAMKQAQSRAAHAERSQ